MTIIRWLRRTRLVDVAFGSLASFWPPASHFRSTPDTVAKVLLRHGTQILRAVGATIGCRRGGPPRNALSSWATLVSGLRLYQPAIVACFVFRREIGD